MKLAALLAAALLLVGCPGNTAQNAPTPPQGGAGHPETPGVASVSTSAPRSAPEHRESHSSMSPVAPVAQGRSGAPTGVVPRSPSEAEQRDVAAESHRAGFLETPASQGWSGANVGAPLFARTGIGTAAGAIRGTARWFSTGPNGVAAAGPRLRAALGSHWRGTLVGVTYRGRTIWLRVGDWCACGSGSIIDLPDEVFARFDPNWHGPKNNSGVLSVTVHWGDRNTLPATDTVP